MSKLNDKRILVIGMGNMATALISGLIMSGSSFKENVFALVHGKKSKANAEELDIHAIKGTGGLNFDVVILALKPQVMLSELTKYSHLVNDNTLFVSIAAGVGIDKIKSLLGENAKVVRAMPNTPSAIGMGVAGLYAPTNVSKEHKELSECLFEASGSYIWIDNEEQMHIVTALSGSGPAYFFYFIEALAEAAIAQGLSSCTAYKLAIETCKGAGAYASHCYPKQTIGKLRESVTSKGGTTEAGVDVMRKIHIKYILSQVIEKARKRSVDIVL